MEDNLYFKPEKSGEKTSNRDKRKGNNHKYIKLLLFLLFLFIVILLIIWLLKGSKTVSGQYPENLKNESLQCISKEIEYSQVTPTNSNEKELKISVIFNGEDTLSNINLLYTQYYQNETDVVNAEAITHADFNRKLGKYGFTAGKFNNKFTILKNRLIISLYALSSDIDEFSKSFFMIESDALPSSLTQYENNYKDQGFTCISSMD